MKFGKVKKLTAAILAGAFLFTIPVVSHAKRLHDPQVDTKSGIKQLTVGTSGKTKKVKAMSGKDLEKKFKKKFTKKKSTTGDEGELKINPLAPTTVSPSDTSIIGTPLATQQQCVKYLLKNNPHPKIPVSAEEIVSYYYEEATREGIRPDVAFAQALKETGFFRYGGTVTPDQNNYCGLGTTSSTVKGTYFPNPKMGVRAHIQHLLAYTSTRRPQTGVIDPRYDLVRRSYGSNTLANWQDLNGRWAVPGRGYGQDILKMFKAILAQ